MTNQPTAFVFAGQGAQAVGMGRDLAQAYPECQALFDQANTLLGYDLVKIIFEGSETALTQSHHCQPAIFLVSAACLLAFRSRLPSAACVGMAGLSLGEWTALYAAGRVSFADALRVLEARGRFMQDACEEKPGGMLCLVGTTPELAGKIATQSGVEVANFNSPEQTVLSGDKSRILAAEPAALAAGVKRAIALNVAGAYHSSLMASAARKLEPMLAGLAFPASDMPVLSNVTGLPHGAPEAVRENMLKQVTSSVQWIRCIEGFKQQGVTRYVEFGPGRVLSGLIKRIQPDAVTLNVADAASLEKTLAAWA